MSKTAAPPTGPRNAARVVRDQLHWVFDLANEMCGSHGPWAIDAERRHIEEMQKAITDVLLGLSDRKLLALGRKLHELRETCDFEIDQLERDQYDDEED